MSANEEPVSALEGLGGWPGMDLEEPPAPEETEAPPADSSAPAEDAAVDADAPPASGEDSAGEALPEWRQYGFKDEQAMWESFKEAQRYITSLTQGGPEEEEEEDEEEAPAPSFTSADFSALGEIPQVGLSHIQREQLANLMTQDPKAAALWALQRQEYMDPSDYKAVQNHWAQSDPHEYHEFRLALAFHMQEQSRQQEESSRTEYVLTQQRTQAINDAKAALPLMDERSDEFGEWLAAPENRDISNMLDSIQEPRRLQQALVSAFYQYAGPSLYQEMVSSHAAVAAAQAAEEQRVAAEQEALAAKGKGARTQTRTAPGTQNASDADDALRDAILNPWGS